MGYSAINNAGLAADVNSLAHLKMDAKLSSPETIKETAKQFESLFMRELIKSMREATMKSGMLDNAGSDLGTDLLDQQLSVAMSGQPGGLSDTIALQLSRQMGNLPTPPADKASSLTGTAGTASQPIASGAIDRSASDRVIATDTLRHTSRPPRPASEAQSSFVRQHSEAASKIEKATGIPAHFMLGQAGHETGWGKHQIKVKGGAPSYNLFGIKAGAGWTGKVAEVTTTEYVNGVAEKRVAKFRAYDSYEDSFKDYARMITESPRYAKARAQTGSAYAFASGLQKAGYATDPDYAVKLARAINTTQQLRRVQV